MNEPRARAWSLCSPDFNAKAAKSAKGWGTGLNAEGAECDAEAAEGESGRAGANGVEWGGDVYGVGAVGGLPGSVEGKLNRTGSRAATGMFDVFAINTVFSPLSPYRNTTATHSTVFSYQWSTPLMFHRSTITVSNDTTFFKMKPFLMPTAFTFICYHPCSYSTFVMPNPFLL